MFDKPSSDRAWSTTTTPLLITLGAAFAAVLLSLADASTATSHGQAFTVRSTLSGKTVLPHRIQWLGIPTIASSKIKEVDFLIDGKIRWREQRAPYTYGGDGNLLVTSWLTPGRHRFTVEAISTSRSHATASVSARVRAAAPPPPSLAGNWQRIVTKAEAANALSSPPGRWRLTIDKVGWRFRDPGTHGALVEVAYLSPGLIEARSGIVTKLPFRGDEGNIWCDEPFQPVRYRWIVEGGTLMLALAGPKRCDGQSNIWAGEWSRA